ncbi:MAG: hypothetical protein RLZZ609_2421 [Cyanobacteriota bacterium]|jgi:HAD superfamily hydrolase (TIGR01509 family)
MARAHPLKQPPLQGERAFDQHWWQTWEATALSDRFDTSPVKLNALLWDVDGTLAETEFHGHRLAFNQAFAEADLPWRWDESTYRQLLAVSGGRERIRAFLKQQPEPSISAVQVESLMATKQRAYAHLARTGCLPLQPGVKRLVLEAAAQGVCQALVTTSSRSAVAALLEGHGSELAQCFDFWICGEDVEAKKPNPEGYEQALRRLQLPPSQVLALEDSRQGLAAAMAAGLPCLLTLGEAPGSSEPRWWERATASLTHLGERGDPTQVVHGPPCQQAEVTLSWLSRLLEGA